MYIEGVISAGRMTENKRSQDKWKGNWRYESNMHGKEKRLIVTSHAGWLQGEIYKMKVISAF